MKTYDKYYQVENFFGEPYPELIAFFSEYPEKGKVLDLGCGQGRNAISLARLGYDVLGVDTSKVGIEQMNQVAQAESLTLVGQVGDIFTFGNFETFDFILLDSMFHFAKKDREKEVGLIQKITSKIKTGCLLVICIQQTANKVQILNDAIDHDQKLHRIKDKKLNYIFVDNESGHRSASDYRMIIAEK